MRLPDDWQSKAVSVLFLGIVLLLVPAGLWALLTGVKGFFTGLSDGFAEAFEAYVIPALKFIHFDVIIEYVFGAISIMYFLILVFAVIFLMAGVGYIVKSIGSHLFNRQ